MRSFSTFVGFVALLLTEMAGAAPVSILNPGFEDEMLSDGSVGTATGWAVSGVCGSFNPTVADGIAPEGQSVGFCNSGGQLCQTLNTSLEQGHYELRVLVGRRLNVAFGAPYSVQLLAGSNLLAQDNNTLSPAPGEFLLSTVTYNAAPNDPNLQMPLEICLTSATQVNWDDVRLDLSSGARGVPVLTAPTSLAFLTLALALIGVGGLVRNTRRRSA